MKALSVIMPWPWLILHHGKDVENRSWRTNYRGRLFIHASLTPAADAVQIVGRYHANITADELQKLFDQCGCIVGSVEVVDCVRNYDSPWAMKGFWHWVLRDPVPLEKPIPIKGHLGLWEYEPRKNEEQR